MIYNKQQLIDINPSYHAEHIVMDVDVEKANKLSTLIEASRNDAMPVDGDRVIYTDENGKIYKWALFAGKSLYGDESYSLCEESYTPFVYISRDGSIRTNASGGARPVIRKNELRQFKLIKKAKATFCDWGHCGATGNGAFDFQAIVNVWEFKLSW